MPLSPNGKLDRMKLPPPGRARPDWAGAFEPPRGATETALCRIIAAVLDLESIGRHDNFFELGGSSLLAVRVVDAVRREGLGVLPVTMLFQHPAPAALAPVLATLQGGDGDVAVASAAGTRCRRADRHRGDGRPLPRCTRRGHPVAQPLLRPGTVTRSAPGDIDPRCGIAAEDPDYVRHVAS